MEAQLACTQRCTYGQQSTEMRGILGGGGSEGVGCGGTQLVLATVPDRHFGSGSGYKPDSCQIGGLGCQ